MSHSTLFSSGLELKTLVTSAALLRRSWAVISDLHRSVDSSSLFVEYKVHEEPDLTIIAFEANQQLLKADLISSSDLSIPHFKFLCTKNNPSFSVNKSAIDQFCFLAQQDKLNQLKSQIDSHTPLIVTGHAFGGSIALLFTLWLLDAIGPTKKGPFCITFGSPLIGDQNLQKAISRSSTWNSCFLHLAYYKDALPRSFISHSNYMPVGTFLLCSEYGASYFENPESTLEVLHMMDSYIGNVNEGFQGDFYGEILENLKRKAICKEFTARVDNVIYSNCLEVSIRIQLQALGLVQMQQQQQNIGINRLVEKIMRGECTRRKKFDPSEKLNLMKIEMAKLEWYKKHSQECGIGYYDSFKNNRFTHDQDAIMFKKALTNYWKDMVAEAEKKPQKEGAAFRTRWLFAGTNCRRMVEPLDIAEHYREGGKDYLAQRSNHYIQLEKWLEEDQTALGNLNSSKKQNVESILTLDSCFWAHVEEAVLLCETLKSGGNGEASRKLIEFENYVFGLLKNYAVSPEIFLKQSSYMTWWRSYEGIVGASYNSALANFMRSPINYEQYAVGAYDFC